MKLREVFRYEIEHRLRSPSTWVYAAILLGLAFSLNGLPPSLLTPELGILFAQSTTERLTARALPCP